MPSSNVCWGIEVGAGAIKAVKVEREGETLKLSDFAVIPHKKVLSTPELDQVDAIRVRAGRAGEPARHEEGDDRHLDPGALGVSRGSPSSRRSRPKKIPDIVKFEAVQQIPFPIDDVEWDYQDIREPGTPRTSRWASSPSPASGVMEKLAQWHDVGG